MALQLAGKTDRGMVAERCRHEAIYDRIPTANTLAVPAGAGEVDGGDGDIRGEPHDTGREESHFPVDLHAQRTLRKARGQFRGAVTVQTVRVGDLDDHGVLTAVDAGGHDGEARDVGGFG